MIDTDVLKHYLEHQYQTYWGDIDWTISPDIFLYIVLTMLLYPVLTYYWWWHVRIGAFEYTSEKARRVSMWKTKFKCLNMSCADEQSNS